ncbi:MAG: GNAT family N-acetyltransferase [Myxococcota bacterium]|nr:GNAT family N-acetyltransferase [Myxococcota bacterium]
MEVRPIARVTEIDAERWNALVGDDDPFVEHAFLAALEESGSVGPGTGWEPTHITAWRDGELVGALPLYAKDESWGEFIFDFQWARAAMQARIPYYPKLTAMVPFTPATGRRLLIRDGADRASVVRALIDGAREVAETKHASSVHVLFVNDEERRELVELASMRPRLSMQYHWHNEGWSTFEEYLDAFRAPARKQVRRERRTVAESDVEVIVKEGPALDDADWRALGVFYRMNCARHGSFPYLNPRFFERIRETNAHRLVAVLAYRGGTPIAGSINFEKGAHLYGRYWGCVQDDDFLHFEVCYYRLIERAIAKKMRRFEAGAQGSHKLKRGLMPSAIHSTHWMRHPRLAEAVEDYLPREAFAVQHEIDELAAMGPFKRG